MNCDEWRLFLQDYLSGILSEPAKAAIDRHLSDCAACFAEARAYRQVEIGLAGEPLLEPPPGIADRILARVQRPASAWKRELVRLAAAAGLLVGLGVAAWSTIPREKVQETLRSNVRAHGQHLESWLNRAGVAP